MMVGMPNTIALSLPHEGKRRLSEHAAEQRAREKRGGSYMTSLAKKEMFSSFSCFSLSSTPLTV